MQAKLFLVLAALLGRAAADQIFTYNLANVFSEEETKEALKKILKPVDVARQLARTGSKLAKIDGIPIQELLNMSRYNLEADCAWDVIAIRVERCESLKGSLLKYCTHCIDHIKEACKAEPIKIFKLLDGSSAVYFQQARVEQYIKDHWIGDDYPLKMYMVDYMYSLRNDREQYKHFCDKLVTSWDMEASFFKIAGDALKTRGKDGMTLDRALTSCRYVLEDKY